MTDLGASPESKEEVVRRLPEVDAIKGNLRTEMIDIFMNDVPDYFWLVRASKSHHPPDERGLGGLWLHTKRAFFAWTVVEPTMREMSVVDTFEANCARCAILLHDSFKYDSKEEREVEEEAHAYLDEECVEDINIPSGSSSDHGEVAAEFVLEETDLPPEVADLIISHDGAWFDGRSPNSWFEMAHHFADAFASNDKYRLPVAAPCEELTMLIGQDFPVIEDPDEWIQELHDYV